MSRIEVVRYDHRGNAMFCDPFSLQYCTPNLPVRSTVVSCDTPIREDPRQQRFTRLLCEYDQLSLF